MAIVVEEEQKKPSSLITILIWIVIFGVITAAAYYVFFRKPELIERSLPVNFQSIDELGKIKLTPEDIINNPDFVALKTYISLPAPDNVGKTNPFLGF
jgi:flagellar basal body-associated protein FliL